MLIVDDFDDTREAIVTLLLAKGFDAVGAASGPKALDDFQAGMRPCSTWVAREAALVLVVYGCTAILGQLAPPRHGTAQHGASGHVSLIDRELSAHVRRLDPRQRVASCASRPRRM